jgi:predicted nuclease of restriction endonuclease-like (RecB) superfamily
MKEHPFDPARYQEILQQLKRASRADARPDIRAYWLIGQLLDAGGAPTRAALQALSQQLAQDAGRAAYPPRKLRLMQRFYRAFPDEHSLRAELPWSHYCLLLRVKQPAARAYYAAEAAAAHWSIRELARQIGTAYYERQPRLGRLAQEPIVLEFLGLSHAAPLSERALEDAILSKLQDFLLELGRGFAFVARQKRLALPEGKPAYIDLVFYHFRLQCFVLIDLKAAPLSQRDICQMDRYVRLYDDKWRQPTDQPTLGIILCPAKDPALVQYSILAENPRLSVATYQLYLPTPTELSRWIGLPVQPANPNNGMKKTLF